MAGNKITKKVRFLPYLPYGYCSRLAITMEGKNNPFAAVFRSFDDPEGLVAQSDQYRKAALKRTRLLFQKGYAKDSKCSCGNPIRERSFGHLTKLGLAVLIEALDEAINDGGEADNNLNAHNGKIKENHFRSGSQASIDLRESLAATAELEDQALFNETLLSAVIDGQVTPLTQAISIANDAKINFTKYSANQRYNIWRLSHIQAMFQANNYLTYLDRRPYDTGFAIDGIADENSFQAYTQKHGLTLPAFTYKALTEWYKNNPGFYRFTQLVPDESEEAKEEWIATPAFYAAHELPYNDSKKTIQLGANAMGSKQVINAIHVGLATGKKINYVVYHGKPGPFKWLPRRELQTKEEITRSVRTMKTRCPEMPIRDNVDFALFFCSSHHQFLAFFDGVKKRHIKHQKQTYITNEPYRGIYIIPVNDSGAALLWCLLEFTPSEAENKIHESLIANDDNIKLSAELYYPITYNDKRVLSGYTMDLRRICNALEDHLDGHDFYIACFPDQIPWYKKLFPEKEFL